MDYETVGFYIVVPAPEAKQRLVALAEVMDLGRGIPVWQEPAPVREVADADGSNE